MTDGETLINHLPTARADTNSSHPVKKDGFVLIHLNVLFVEGKGNVRRTRFSRLLNYYIPRTENTYSFPTSYSKNSG